MQRIKLIPGLVLIAAAMLLTSGLAVAEEKQKNIEHIKIGVLSHRGAPATLINWSPTARYLTDTIPGYYFQIIPLGFEEVEPAVRDGDVDFILVNPGIYVSLEVNHRISRIATLNNRHKGISYNIFGGVIFTHRNRDDISTLEDLTGKRVQGVDEISLGGYQMAWGELAKVGMSPYRDLQELSFAGTHDKVVMNVVNQKVDAGIVRTDILERMAEDKRVLLEDIKIVNRQRHPDFPFHHSTPLYPEWPFSKVGHTTNELAQTVAVALLNMPRDHLAAVTGRYAGWTIPLDYQPVHDLFRELGLPPYDEIGEFTLADAVQRYWYGILIGMIVLLVLIFMTTWVTRLNRELEKSKQSLEQRHELILNSVADGIYGVDLSGNSTFMNRAMARITGWSHEEVIGYNQHELLHHTHSDGSPFPAEECPVFQTFRDDKARFVDEDTFWKKDGTNFPVEYSSTPLKDNSGTTVGSVVVFRDITERKRAEEKAAQHLAEMAHVSRLNTMGEMASGIAHELNQPLAAINTSARACIRLLENGSFSDDDMADVMDRVAGQAERAGEIIRQLREFVRKDEPERNPVTIGDLLNGVTLLIRPEAAREDVMMHMEVENPDDRVLVQRIQIEQVILNLMRNAIEAMVDTPTEQRMLTISSHPGPRGCVVVEVGDTGPGMDAAMLEKIFDPFVTTKQKGMGLGLSISQGIIEAHDGDLNAESVPGEGTVFRFRLPVIDGGGPNDE